MTRTFCALPWKHLTVNHYGGAQICCVSRSMIREDNTDVSLYTRSLKETFNAESIRQVRINMLKGEKSTECQLCYDNEANGLKSERLIQNATWREKSGFDIATAKRNTEADGHLSTESPEYLQLMVSNVCNLACRMCNGESSSKIELDSVHGAWAPGYNNFGLPVWDGNQVEIGPAQKLGVTRHGINEITTENSTEYWIKKHASFKIPRMEETYTGCEIYIHDLDLNPTNLTVAVDKTSVFQGTLNQNNQSKTIWFENIKPTGKDLTLEISIDAGGPVHLKSVRLVKETNNTQKGESALSRFSEKKKPLFEQDSFLFHELLRNADTMQRLYVVGGEPFYAKPLLRMIDYLDDTGDCAHIDAVFTSNATIVNDKLLAQLQKFREVHIGFSIEGFGPIQEYIRYPSKWQEIETNIKKFRDIDGIKIHVVATLQLQSALYLTDLLRFCDKLQIACGVNLVYYPDYLNILALPRAARTAAAERLETYLENDNPSEACRNELLPIINHLTSDDDMFSHDLMRQFMLFTNDLDKGRQQSFRDTFPELLAFIEDTGFQWTDETRYFNKISKQKS